MIYGNTFIQWTLIQRSTHLILTSAIWGSIIYLLLSISKNKYNFSCWDCNERSNIKSWVVVGIIAIVSIIITTILWGGLKPIKEFYSNGIVIWLFKNVYYLFEVGLILLTIVFGQRYGEIKFVSNNCNYIYFIIYINLLIIVKIIYLMYKGVNYIGRILIFNLFESKEDRNEFTKSIKGE